VWVFDLNSKSNAHISHKNIIAGYPQGIICVCWKWAHEKSVRALDWGQRQNDRPMLKKFIAEMDRADEIVMQNGDRFDVPWIRGRAIYHGLPMAPSYVTNDTLKKSRQKFRFPSHRLDYMGNYLIGEDKLPTTFGLWKSIMEEKCEKSLRRMVRYCKQDVRLLESIFNRFRPYIEPITSIASFPRDCPECGGRCTKHQTRRRAKGSIAYSLICTSCGCSHTITKAAYDKNKRFATA